MQSAYKFGAFSGSEEVPYRYPDIYAREGTSGPDRLVIAPSENHVSFLLDLLPLIPEPLGILYVLVVPRTGEKGGRYQISTPISRTEAEVFLRTFQAFFENDARHHIWVYSVSTPDLLVYDNHNLIYAYGSLVEFEQRALEKGLRMAEAVRFPVPHTHKYNAIFDDDERRLLDYFGWKLFPLRKDDD